MFNVYTLRDLFQTKFTQNNGRYDLLRTCPYNTRPSKGGSECILCCTNPQNGAVPRITLLDVSTFSKVKDVLILNAVIYMSSDCQLVKQHVDNTPVF